LLQKLPMLKDSLQVTFYGSHTCHNFGKKENIPTLEEVFKCFPDTPINLDVKGEEEELVIEVRSVQQLAVFNFTIASLHKLV